MASTQVEYGLGYISPQELDDEDEEVYSGPGSTLDIWKKFELGGIPTPPLSPSRQAASNGASSPTCLTSAADTLQNIIDVDSSRTTLLFPDSSCPNLKSKLIQDCMWGSNEKIQRVAYIENIYATPCSTPPPLDYVSADCVDPSSVFPYPINNQDFTSDSSEDEGEIDVVTIEKTEKPVRRKVSAPECPNDNDDDESASDSETVAKKPRMMYKRLRSVKETEDTSANDKLELEGPECKRTVHNVLERKRRNDLKYSFQVLRDSVPDLKGSERAPKVAILKKATDCIHNLKSDEEILTKQKDNLMKKHQSLLCKLKSLQESAK